MELADLVQARVMKQLLREPLLHFLLAGIALFLVYEVVRGGVSDAPRDIVITEPRVEAMAASFATVWMRPPTAVEPKGLIDDYVAEEIYYREAVAIGLDQDDTVIRRRLRQKMEFISEDIANSVEPADAYEQLGYQKESPSVRNSFLQGAYELRSGMPTGNPVTSSGPDVVRAMSTDQWLDFLGISMDPKRADGMRLTINLVTPDNGEKYLIELSNATLTNIKGIQSPKPDLTITVDRAELNRVMLGVATFDQLGQEGKATFDGDRNAIYKLRDLMVTFTPDFEFIPGSAPDKRQVPPGRPFALPELNLHLNAE